MTAVFESNINHQFSKPTILALDSSDTALSSASSNINTFMRMPQIGDYILGACRKMAYRVIRHVSAKACGQNLTVVFFS